MQAEVLSNKELWEKIDRFDIANIGGSFFQKLTSEYGWSGKFARQAIKEYKKFIYLANIAGKRVSPPRIVDKVWHTHLTYTDNYWNEFCPKILGKQIHHYPSEKNKDAKQRDEDDFSKTIGLYEREFGNKPPKMIWSNSLRGAIKLAFVSLGIILVSLGVFKIISAFLAIILIFGGFVSYSYVMGGAWASGVGVEIFDYTDCGTCGSSTSSGDCGSSCGGCGD